MGLCVTLKYGDIVKIGDALVSVEKYSSQQVRVKIDAPKIVEVKRIKKGENDEYKSVSHKDSEKRG